MRRQLGLPVRDGGATTTTCAATNLRRVHAAWEWAAGRRGSTMWVRGVGSEATSSNHPNSASALAHSHRAPAAGPNSLHAASHPVGPGAAAIDLTVCHKAANTLVCDLRLRLLAAGV